MEAAKQAPSPVFSATPAASSGNGLGVVSGSASGGRVLEKETISADTLDFLKSYNKWRNYYSSQQARWNMKPPTPTQLLVVLKKAKTNPTFVVRKRVKNAAKQSSKIEATALMCL